MDILGSLQNPHIDSLVCEISYNSEEDQARASETNFSAKRIDQNQNCTLRKIMRLVSSEDLKYAEIVVLIYPHLISP